MREKERVSAKASNCAVIDNKVIFACKDCNLIYTLDLQTSKITVWDDLPDERFTARNLYGNVIVWNQYVILVPQCAEKIWIYDFKNKKWNGIGLDQKYSKLMYKFFGALVYNNKLYMFGHYFPGILELNLETYEKRIVDIDFQKIINANKEMDGLFYWDYVIQEEWLIIPMMLSNEILKFNLETEESQIIKVGSDGNRYCGIDWDGQQFWLAPRKNGPMVRWNGENQVEEYALPNEYSNDLYYFIGICVTDREIVIPSYMGLTLHVSKEDMGKKQITDDAYLFFKKIDNNTYAWMKKDGSFCLIQGGNKRIEIKCFIDGTELNNIYDKYLKNIQVSISQEIVEENDVFMLEHYLEIIKNLDKKSDCNAKDNENNGTKIYTYLCKY